MPSNHQQPYTWETRGPLVVTGVPEEPLLEDAELTEQDRVFVDDAVTCLTDPDNQQGIFSIVYGSETRQRVGRGLAQQVVTNLSRLQPGDAWAGTAPFRGIHWIDMSSDSDAAAPEHIANADILAALANSGEMGISAATGVPLADVGRRLFIVELPENPDQAHAIIHQLRRVPWTVRFLLIVHHFDEDLGWPYTL